MCSIAEFTAVFKFNKDIKCFSFSQRLTALTHLLTHHIAAFYDFLRSKHNSERVALDNVRGIAYTVCGIDIRERVVDFS